MPLFSQKSFGKSLALYIFNGLNLIYSSQRFKLCYHAIFNNLTIWNTLKTEMINFGAIGNILQIALPLQLGLEYNVQMNYKVHRIYKLLVNNK